MQKTIAAILLLVPIAAVGQVSKPDSAQQPDQTQSLPVSILDLPPGATPPHLSAPRDCTPPRDINHQIVAPAILEFKVTALGAVRDIVVRQSSGDSLVDRALVDCVSGWLYAPAMADGRPIQVSLRTSINVKLQSAGSNPLVLPASAIRMPVRQRREGSMWCETWHQNSDRGTLLSFYVEIDGSIKNISIVETSGDTKTDKDAVACVSQRAYEPGSKNGKPVEVRMTDWLYSPRYRQYPRLNPWLP